MFFLKLSSNAARPALFRDGGATGRIQSALPMAAPLTHLPSNVADRFATYRPAAAADARRVQRTGEIFEIRESVGPCGLE
jgi:hypothetical protein